MESLGSALSFQACILGNSAYQDIKGMPNITPVRAKYPFLTHGFVGSGERHDY